MIILAVLMVAYGGGKITAKKSVKDKAVVSAKPAEPTPPVISAPLEEKVQEEEEEEEEEEELIGSTVKI
jgi:hypothetical protein